MTFIFHTSISFESWNWENSVKKGIGGSETSIVEMSWRLAAKGHEVIVYAPIPNNSPHEWRRTKWFHFSQTDWKKKGIWIIYRVPSAIDKFPSIDKRKDQQVWLLEQDWDYPDLTEERLQNFDKIITLCQTHGKYIVKQHSNVGDKLWLSSNGIKVDLIEKIEKEKITRNPLRIMYASSPDRGLKQAIIIFKKAKELIPNLELHAFYGFNNLNKIVDNKFISPDHFLVKARDELLQLIKETKDVYFHGRVSQNNLYREWFKSGIYLYITDFFETSNIASQEAQAMGAVPVFSPVFAQGENIKHGIAVEGKSLSPLTLSRAAAEVVRLAQHQELQETIRISMMDWARKRFNWENFVTQWELEVQGKRKEFEEKYDFPQQLIVKKIPVGKYLKFEEFTEKFLKDHIKGKTILDVGGYNGKQAAWCIDNGAKTATVVDNESWKTYNQWADFKPFENVEYIKQDFMNYNIPADVVIFQNVIYHLRNPWAALEKIRNLTKELLIISTSYVPSNNQEWRVYKPRQGHPVSWTVAWRPSISGLKALLEINGFKIIDEEIANKHIVLKCTPIEPSIGFQTDKVSYNQIPENTWFDAERKVEY